MNLHLSASKERVEALTSSSVNFCHLRENNRPTVSASKLATTSTISLSIPI